jgi:sodium-dependent dicarboxylate transporter 2/3/5
MGWEESSLGLFFMLLVCLWLTRDIYAINGWGCLFEKKLLSDTTPAIFILILITVWPKHNIFKGKKYENMIVWKSVQEQFPWSIILFTGGAFAMVKGFAESKLTLSIGHLMQNIMPGQQELALLLIIVLSGIGTEFTCNCSIASILLPIIDSLAKENNISPFYLLLPTITSINLSFILPIATPTNSIIFASGYVKTKDMLISGLIIKIIGFLVIMLASNTWLFLIFDSTLFVNQRNSTFALDNPLLNSTASRKF